MRTFSGSADLADSRNFFIRQLFKDLIGFIVCSCQGRKICRMGYSMFLNVTFFHLKLLLDNSASFTSSRMKGLCQKWKVTPTFKGACRLSGTGIVERLEIIDIGCNLKSLMAWPDWPPYSTTDLRHWLEKPQAAENSPYPMTSITTVTEPMIVYKHWSTVTY